jgi:glycosyltransferase involved in cell wall biosynthesis
VALEVAYLRDRPGLQAEFEAAGVALHCLDGPGGRAGWARRATQLLRRRRPDLVHTTLFEADIAGRVAAVLARTPVVTSLVTVMYGPEHYGNPGLRRWRLAADQVADGVTARAVRRFHAVSSTVAEALGRRLRLDPKRIDVIPRGRDPKKLGVRSTERRARARAGLGVETQTPLLLAVARQDQAKGLDVLLRAVPAILAAVPRARLFVAGRSGNQSAELQRLVADLAVGSAVRFLGPRDDVADLLCAADLFVLPSRREGSPGSLLEAMALGTPAVVSGLREVREVVDEHAAWLVPSERPEALARAVGSALSDPDAAGARAEVARQVFFDRYTMDVCADRMVNFYRRSMARSRT